MKTDSSLKRSTFKADAKILEAFLKVFWFAPQDVLLRSTEAVIMRRFPMKHPILEVGVGDGGISALMYPKNLIIDHGFDINEGGLASARATKKYKKVTSDNAEAMHIKPNSFNTVICNSTCEHITRDAKAIKEMGRVLKKSGVLHLTVPSAYLPKMILEFEHFQGSDHPQRDLDRFNARVVHLHYHTLSQWTKMLSAGGMKVSTYKYYFPENTTRVWYTLMKFSISKVAGREMWSWVGQSRLSQFLPKVALIWYLKHIHLKNAYRQAFETPDDIGAMLYIQAVKK